MKFARRVARQRIVEPCEFPLGQVVNEPTIRPSGTTSGVPKSKSLPGKPDSQRTQPHLCPTLGSTWLLLDGWKSWNWTSVREHLSEGAERNISSLAKGLISKPLRGEVLRTLFQCDGLVVEAGVSLVEPTPSINGVEWAEVARASLRDWQSSSLDDVYTVRPCEPPVISGYRLVT